MRPTYYKRDGMPYDESDVIQWAKDFEKEDRRVAKDILPDGKVVSTVFLGLDHNFGEGPPLIFETMIFLSEKDSDEVDCDRYSTEEQALKGHKTMVKKWIKKAKEQPK